jgi:hypothetical protein
MKRQFTSAVLLLTFYSAAAHSDTTTSNTITAKQAEETVKSYKAKGQWPYLQTLVFKNGTVKVSNDGENWFKVDMVRYTREHP